MTQHETPEEVERRLARERADIGATIDAIQNRLSPGQLLDQAMGYVKSGGGDMAATLSRSAGQNPWPLVLTGVGLTWLIASTASRDASHAHSGPSSTGAHYPPPAPVENEHTRAIARYHATMSEVQKRPDETDSSFQDRLTEARGRAFDLKRNAGETAEAFKARVQEKYSQTESKVAELKRSAADAVRDGADSARRHMGAFQDAAHDRFNQGRDALSEHGRVLNAQARHTSERAKELYEAEPLIAGAVGALAGVLIGALLPTTRAENRAFGTYGERARSAAYQAADQAAGEAEALAAETARVAADTAAQNVREKTEEKSSTAQGGRRNGQTS